MKQSERQNEMDILLRGMAKQASSVSETDNGKQQSAAHLDADELNAFAEHTLPPATQARYTAHLVDCSQCRKLIAQLSAAAGLPKAEVKSEATKTSFWERLPAFLSPAVLRFAVPALGMLAVITVGIVTLRQQENRSAEYVAQNEQQAATQSKPSVLQESPEAHDQIQPSGNVSPAPGLASAPAVKPAKAGEDTGTVDKVTTADTSSGVGNKDAPKPSKADAGEAQPAFAPEPAPPAVAKQQAPASTPETKNEAVAKDKAAAPGVASLQSRDTRTAAQDAAEDREASVSRKAATAGRGGALNRVESRRNETEQTKRADQTDAITEVAGRRFRKQGNTWIDTAYDSGRPAITIVRGSEQYRALTADEPGIRTIAERLAGEVLVVWKGRAYRIR